MSRSQTGKTSRLVILMRLYFWAFLWSSPAIWYMWKYGGVKEGQIFGDLVYTHADEVASRWFFPELLFGMIAALLAIVWLLTRIGAWLVIPNDADFVAWKKAGGDSRTWIHIPPVFHPKGIQKRIRAEDTGMDTKKPCRNYCHGKALDVGAT